MEFLLTLWCLFILSSCVCTCVCACVCACVLEWSWRWGLGCARGYDLEVSSVPFSVLPHFQGIPQLNCWPLSYNLRVIYVSCSFEIYIKFLIVVLNISQVDSSIFQRWCPCHSSTQFVGSDWLWHPSHCPTILASNAFAKQCPWWYQLETSHPDKYPPNPAIGIPVWND